MQHRSGREQARGESGAATIDYVGAIVVVVAIVVSLALSATPIGQTIAARLCEAFGTTCGEVTSAARAPEDYVPPMPCVVSGNGEDNDANLSFVVVTLRGGERWLIEKLGDGRYRLTRGFNGGAGATVGVGGGVTLTVDDSVYGGQATADASAGLSVGGGETFYVDSVEDAQNLLGQQRQDDVKDAVLGDSGVARGFFDWVSGKLGDDQEGENRAPDEWFVEGGTWVDGQASASGGLPGLNADAGASGSVEAYLGRTERSDGTSTDYLRASMSIEAGLSGNVPNANGYNTFAVASAGGQMSALIQVDRDANGTPVALRLTSTTGGHAATDQSYVGMDDLDTASSLTSVTSQIPLETASDLRTASRTLQTLGIPYVPGITDPTDIGQRALTPSAFTQVATDFAALAASRGYYWEQDVTSGSTTDFGLQVDVKMGAVAGLGGSTVSNESTTTGYRYWDGGQMVSREGCVS
jgi:hypothetical protein